MLELLTPDRLKERKRTVDDSAKSKTDNSEREIPAISVSGNLGVMLLVENIRQGNEVRIPSLDMKLTKDNLKRNGFQPSGSDKNKSG